MGDRGEHGDPDGDLQGLGRRREGAPGPGCPSALNPQLLELESAPCCGDGLEILRPAQALPGMTLGPGHGWQCPAATRVLRRGALVAIKFGLLTTFPPTQCGIATFSHALATHLRDAGAEVSVVRVVDSPQLPVLMVSHQLVSGRPYAALDAADVLNECDVAILQHEYGIFGGRDGADVLDVLDDVRVPLIAVLHTVLANPTPHQHEILARILDRADIAVTMTHAGRDRLIAGWDTDPAAVRVIAHGAHDSRTAGVSAPRGHRPTVLTWGLLGEGKGIEWALEAVASVADLKPQPLYKVVGQTHPRVLERDGEAYRDRLTASVRRLGISSMVEFDARYLDTASLQRIVRSADVVLLPYDPRGCRPGAPGCAAGPACRGPRCPPRPSRRRSPARGTGHRPGPPGARRQPGSRRRAPDRARRTSPGSSRCPPCGRAAAARTSCGRPVRRGAPPPSAGRSAPADRTPAPCRSPRRSAGT